MLIKAFIKLCKEIKDDAKAEKVNRGMYIKEETPKALGTKITRKENTGRF